MTDAMNALLIPDQVSEAERELMALREVDVVPLRRMVDEYRDGTEPGRMIGQKSRAYYDGNQIDGPLKTALTRSRQPKIIRNEIKPAINGLLGIIQQAKVDPKAYPRNPDNEKQADVASKALRYVADKNRLHKLKVNLAENHLIEGAFGVAVEVDGNDEPVLSQIRYDELIYDPRSRQADFSDALYKGIGKWMYERDLRRMYPDFQEDISSSFSSNMADFGLGPMYDDKPSDLLGSYWMDKAKRRLFVVELYHREDVWMKSVFFVGGVFEHGPSAYRDDEGSPVCPLVLGSCFIDDQNQRYGLVRSMLSPQDEYNAYASRSLHLANSRQLQAADPNYPPEVDSRTASQEAKKADGVIPVGWQIVPTADLFAGIQVMMESARQALVRQAPTPSVLADASAQNQSGRSRLVLQQAGMTEIARAFGRLEDAENEIYRQIWMRLKQFKRGPWWVRMTGDDGKQNFEGVNIPEPMQNEQGAVVVDMMGQPIMQLRNELATMDVDIEVETIPDTANLQAEQFEGLSPMFPLLAQAIGPERAFNVALAVSSIPDKHRVKELIDAPTDDPQAQQAAQAQAQMAQQAAQLQAARAQADIAETNSKALLNDAKTRETEAKVVQAAMQAMSPQGQDLQSQ